MKDNKIDKAFKEGLKGGKMPYSESYWADMETLIPAPVAAAKATAALGYRLAAWFIGIALVGTAGYFWFSGTTAEVALPSQTNKAQEVEGQVAQPTIENAKAIESPKTEIEHTQAITEAEASPKTKTNTNTSIKEEKAISVATLNENPTKVSTTSAGSVSTVADQPTESVTESLVANNDVVLPTTNKTENETEGNAEIEAATIVQQTQKTNTSTGTEVTESTSEQNATASAEEKANEQNSIVSQEVSESNEVTPNVAEALPVRAPEAAAAPIILPHQKGKKLLWSAGVDYQYLLLNRSLSTTNASLTDYIDFRTSNENPTYQSSVGLNVQLEMDNWLFNSGVYKTTFHEDINYPSTLLVDVGVDNSYWQINDIWNYTVDSAWVIDSIYVGHWQRDTAWSLTVDSLWQEQWDTVATEKEAPEMALNNGVFALSYVEIPLWFGRSFGKNNFHFDVQGGIGLGILSGTKGSLYINQNVDGLVTPAYQLEQFSRLNMSGMLRVGIRYEFTEQLQAMLYPTVRYTLTSVFNDAAIRQRYFGYGVTVGVLYRF